MPVCLVSAGKKIYKNAYMSIFREFVSQSHYFIKTIRFIMYKTKFINEINISNTFYQVEAFLLTIKSNEAKG